MNAEIKIESIGIKEAKEMVSRMFPGQRNLRGSQVKRLVMEMKAGRFRLSQDALVLINGLLANGQHRLMAVIEVGNGSFPFLVLRTNDPEIYKVMDDGMKRKVNDYLGVENACLAAAAGSLAVEYDKGELSILGYRTATRGENLEYNAAHQETLGWATKTARALCQKQRLMPGSVVAAFLEIGARFDKEQAIQFVTEVITGEGQSATCRVLRERLIKERISKFKVKSPYIFGLLIKSYRAYYESREIKALRFAEQESFPKFPGD